MQYRAQDPPETVADVNWSPSGDHAIAWQTTVVPERVVTIVHALAKDGQPALVKYPYAKPGDPIPSRTPRSDRCEESERKFHSTKKPSPIPGRFGWNDSVTMEKSLGSIITLAATKPFVSYAWTWSRETPKSSSMRTPKRFCTTQMERNTI